MSQKSVSVVTIKREETLGEQVRRIADQLKQETDLQIKATSRILGAAAQISENHDRLIHEVVNMVEEDLEKQTQILQKKIYTIEMLKEQFITLKEAKSCLGLKASSWAALASKINNLSVQIPAFINSSNGSVLTRLDSIERKLETMHIEVSQILSLLIKLAN